MLRRCLISARDAMFLDLCSACSASLVAAVSRCLIHGIGTVPVLVALYFTQPAFATPLQLTLFAVPSIRLLAWVLPPLSFKPVMNAPIAACIAAALTLAFPAAGKPASSCGKQVWAPLWSLYWQSWPPWVPRHSSALLLPEFEPNIHTRSDASDMPGTAVPDPGAEHALTPEAPKVSPAFCDSASVGP
ncbi:uncharacterized protein TEOVI_000690400 [Trypanosoma equiperdum]|uniref:Uncharacterized protein n=1 Tax=Trypanosoma equiperdum TaxID=5694 RepID=A0A1G4I9Z6_TRYEQ|nr:hypothetical protein TEOVI_000690400 [Trypanosoma equiperdum]